MPKSQVFFYILSAFIGGVFIASLFNISLSIILILAIAGILAIALGFNNKYFILAGCLILAFGAGAARFNSFNLGKSNLINLAGQDVVLSGFIDSESVISGTKMKFAFKAEGDDVLITTNAYPERKFGDALEIKGKLQLPENFSDFDYITYLKKEGIQTVMSFPKINAGEINLSLSEKIKIAVYKNIFALKNKFENAINVSIPEPNASFINGILLGARQNIPDDLTAAFKSTGTTHILAISGYNITIISEMILLGLVWFFRRKTSFWISVVVIILFVILTGASASVVRAAVMGLILSFANGYGRLYDPKNSILLTGGIMVFANPFILIFDVGFQLSFGAVLGLIYLYPFLDSKLNKLPDLGGLKELILMTVSAQISVMPLLLYYFGSFSAVALPTNILILPFVPAAMLAGFIVGLTGMFIPFIGQVFGYIAWAITTYQIEVVKYFASGIF